MHDFSRRRFMALVGTAGVAFSLPAAAGSVQMQTRAIPATGARLGIIGYGNAAMFAAKSDLAAARETSRELFRLLLDAGGNFADLTFDSALNLSAWLEPETLGRLMLATGYAAGTRGAPFTDADMRRLAGLLKKPRIDFLQVRNQAGMAATDQHWATLRAAKDAGQAIHIGFTVANAANQEAAMAFMQKEKPDFLQLNYSLLEPAAAERLLPLAADLGVGVIVNRPFVGGQIFSKVRGRDLPGWAADFNCRSWAQFALKFIVSHKAVTCVIPEPGEIAHAHDNLAAGMGQMPDQATRLRMQQFFSAL
jgi:aryl-alcohol dehydrogenase-like predicted oxidoreductase